ncbi:hypothetical protein SSP24_80850 [Streptomyces spinoverrucosus]|uniref:HTH-type transcriptional repressor Sco4008 C-terminal domain-containing protein n=1 Tax=Streptomyces spinoverrucosus TaxID=284043 RepID=A0A4Y3VXQ0_9ACTN|nr:hypothetical protein [Streptomyces spinoverrucosus]GEC10430.1 hypothetical protein SSP24_80850 [Streptomyces spinoverrucosus]GHB48800.1 hypothetical protein GCM10010397_18110 [Streptomyces spinoverrucosus]
MAEATRLDPTDLPEYAGRVHDYFTPDPFRLMSWGRLEFAGTAADVATQETMRRKVEQLRKAQEAGGRRPGPRPLLGSPARRRRCRRSAPLSRHGERHPDGTD